MKLVLLTREYLAQNRTFNNEDYFLEVDEKLASIPSKRVISERNLLSNALLLKINQLVSDILKNCYTIDGKVHELNNAVIKELRPQIVKIFRSYFLSTEILKRWSIEKVIGCKGLGIDEKVWELVCNKNNVEYRSLTQPSSPAKNNPNSTITIFIKKIFNRNVTYYWGRKNCGARTIIIDNQILDGQSSLIKDLNQNGKFNVIIFTGAYKTLGYELLKLIYQIHCRTNFNKIRVNNDAIYKILKQEILLYELIIGRIKSQRNIFIKYYSQYLVAKKYFKSLSPQFYFSTPEINPTLFIGRIAAKSVGIPTIAIQRQFTNSYFSNTLPYDSFDYIMVWSSHAFGYYYASGYMKTNIIKIHHPLADDNICHSKIINRSKGILQSSNKLKILAVGTYHLDFNAMLSPQIINEYLDILINTANICQNTIFLYKPHPGLGVNDAHEGAGALAWRKRKLIDGTFHRNLHILPQESNLNEIIETSDLIIGISSTANLEAMLRGKISIIYRPSVSHIDWSKSMNYSDLLEVRNEMDLITILTKIKKDGAFCNKILKLQTNYIQHNLFTTKLNYKSIRSILT